MGISLTLIRAAMILLCTTMEIKASACSVVLNLQVLQSYFTLAPIHTIPFAIPGSAGK